jgi:hypothetical protein
MQIDIAHGDPRMCACPYFRPEKLGLMLGRCLASSFTTSCTDRLVTMEVKACAVSPEAASTARHLAIKGFASEVASSVTSGRAAATAAAAVAAPDRRTAVANVVAWRV